ncbi:hypothetical protein B0H19DRAFT_1060041 [Mycena capillaripes]|nr:hypothetical protein B0H19DRAFT_1060041 [Mycena capillaripes]
MREIETSLHQPPFSPRPFPLAHIVTASINCRGPGKLFALWGRVSVVGVVVYIMYTKCREHQYTRNNFGQDQRHQKIYWVRNRFNIPRMAGFMKGSFRRLNCWSWNRSKVWMSEHSGFSKVEWSEFSGNCCWKPTAKFLRTGIGTRFKFTAETMSRNGESFIAWIFVQALSNRSGTSSDACNGCRPLVVGPHAVKIQGRTAIKRLLAG